MTHPGPHVRLAFPYGSPADNCLRGANGVPRIPVEEAPSLLISYHYRGRFWELRDAYACRDWVLDSGAFSAETLGARIDLDAYAEFAARGLAEDPRLSEVFSLDVIGDEAASLRNTEVLWERGIPAIPTFHYGSGWAALEHLVKEYPKIALGGMVGQSIASLDAWMAQCFARIWRVRPTRVHAFGVTSERLLLKYPFHSADSSSWQLGPCGFGRWKVYKNLSWRGKAQDLRAEVDWYLGLEARLRRRWASVMPTLGGENV